MNANNASIIIVCVYMLNLKNDDETDIIYSPANIFFITNLQSRARNPSRVIFEDLNLLCVKLSRAEIVTRNSFGYNLFSLSRCEAITIACG